MSEIQTLERLRDELQAAGDRLAATHEGAAEYWSKHAKTRLRIAGETCRDAAAKLDKQIAKLALDELLD